MGKLTKKQINEIADLILEDDAPEWIREKVKKELKKQNSDKNIKMKQND